MQERGSALASDDVGSLLQRAVEEAARLLHADGGMVYLVDDAGDELALAHDAGITSERDRAWVRGLRLPVGSGMFGKAFVERRVQLTGDYEADEAFPHTEGADRVVREVGIRSMVVAPLMDGARSLGALGAFAARPDAFGEADVALVRALAEHAAAAMTNRRLIEQLARSEAELAQKADAERALRELAARITSSHNRNQILDHIATEATALLGGDIAAINVLASRREAVGWGKAIRPELQSNLRLLDGIALDPNYGISGLALAQDLAVWTDDYLVDERFGHTPDRDEYIRSSNVRSVVCAPLRDERGPIGVIQVHSTKRSAFGARHAELLTALADHAAIALTNARLIEELDASREEVARRAEVERSLREIGARITALRDVDDVIRRTIGEAIRLLGGDGGRIDVVQPDSGLLRGLYLSEDEPPSTDVWPDTPDERPDDGVAGQAVARRRVVRTGDYLADDSFPHATGVDEYVRRTGIRSVIAAPMPGEVGPFGALTVYSPRIDAFDEADEATIAALAEQAAVALTNARLISELAASREELLRRASAEHALGEITGALTAIRDPAEVLQRVVDETHRLVGADGTILSILDTSTDLLRWSFDDGLRALFDPEYVANLTLPLGVGPTGEAVAEGRPVRVDRDLMHAFPDGPENDHFFERTAFRSMVTVPIVAESGTLGALEVYSTREAAFDSADEALLRALADHAAIALTNARLVERLQASEARYRFLVENSPDIVFSTDAEGLYTYYSETVERLTGWQPDELLGRHFSTIIDLETFPEAPQAWAQFIAEPARMQVSRFSLRTKDGRRLPVEVSAVGMTDGEGRFAGIHGAARDVSERDRLERQLRASEERYRYLVSASPDLTWEVDGDGVFTFISDRVRELTGYRPEEIVGRHFELLVHPETLDEAYARYADLAAEPGVVRAARFSLRHRDGHPVPIENFSVGVVRDGVFVGAHGAARDVSERDRLERGLRQQAAELAANEERGHLARELHDSVTQALFSMTLITRSIELLLDRDPSAAREKIEALRDLQRDALAEMRSLIFELRPGSLEQDGLVHALRTHTAAVEGRIGLPVLLEAEPLDRMPIEIEDGLYRIAQEALHNVVKHAAARQVRIALGRVDGTVRLRIEDDGKGFAPEAVPPGHLGLTGMHARAERIGGRLIVNSAPGTGTRIDVEVPVSNPREDAPLAVPAGAG